MYITRQKQTYSIENKLVDTIGEREGERGKIRLWD